MPSRLDSGLANAIIDSAIWRLNSKSGKDIVCERNRLRETILTAIEEACEIGFLKGQKDRNHESILAGSLDRPPWMNVLLADGESLKSHGVRFKRVSLTSLLNAGFRCLGDLRWVSARELRELHYIGIKTARQIRETIERLERSSLALPPFEA